MTPAERTLRAQLAAHTSWANSPDWSARTAPARAGFEARFDKAVIEKHGVLPPREHAKRAEAYRKAYFAALALASARARSARAGRV